MAAEVYALVVAAGRGERMGAERPKQFLPLAGLTVLEHALRSFLDHPEVVDVTVVLAEDSLGELLQLSRRPAALHDAVGGPERAHSVLNGLHAMMGRGVSPEARVLVHDGARPCVTREEIDALLAVGEGVLVRELTATIKRTEHGRVVATVPREGLCEALTPQCFRLGALADALGRALTLGELPTDEADAMERSGAVVAAVPGAVTNIKVTRPDDLALAERILSRRGDDGGGDGA